VIQVRQNSRDKVSAKTMDSMDASAKSFYYRNLPHWHPPGRSIFLTWRLYGSLPQSIINQFRVIRHQLSKRSRPTANTDNRLIEYKKLFAKVDAILDEAKTGPIWLLQSEVASIVELALLEKYAHLYNLWAYVLMANHRHVFLKSKGDVAIGDITKRLKGYTAREANKLLRRTGQPFWQDESFDHWSRDRAEFFRIVDYIENNPVNAGLVEIVEIGVGHRRLNESEED
jgi:REP element-mobilizing transposase RayT